jgi:hypothetical protein
MKANRRGNTTQNSPPPQESTMPPARHRVPKWLCRPDQVLSNLGIHSKVGSHLRHQFGS